MTGEAKIRRTPKRVVTVPDTIIKTAQAIGHSAIYPGNICDTSNNIPVKIRPIKPSHPNIMATTLLMRMYARFTQSNPPNENSHTRVNVMK